ncbi:hypothetical protein IQ238_24285 [Pleurocapsales cyanobacterium LEGE 06147]|nr:hypothetical protein [Pleurocapsales cyanobacterium LEGE 06147]
MIIYDLSYVETISKNQTITGGSYEHKPKDHKPKVHKPQLDKKGEPEKVICISLNPFFFMKNFVGSKEVHSSCSCVK